MSPGELPTVYEVLSIGRHELCDEHGAAWMHAGSQKLHHVHIPAVLQDGNLHQRAQLSLSAHAPLPLLNAGQASHTALHVDIAIWG